MKKAVIYGASGLVGSHLLDELLKNSSYDQVTAIVRKPLPIQHPKLKMLIGDYYTLPNLKDQIEADDMFIALGGTKPKIHVDYPVLAAQIAKEKGAQSVFVITAVGASLRSRLPYLRVKGEIEKKLIALEFEHTHIFRPCMIMGKRKGFHLTEKTVLTIWKFLNPFFMAGMSRYKGMEARNIAQAMRNAVNHQSEKVKIYHWKEMNDLLRS
ncbi:NAD(P)H-binding protein [Cohnella sp. CFH 77786]|uniref:NAD(P)H-binding protein n=1 Tax=Cohnella sp. CFH 77786 TaxID=2662265 RepID=UPI001C60DDE6|nr:NAD(P)H-binding protein [Cohnella sp. CFH 77786]MBW5448727.1 NAD(P)H-binding protein [Cohnella sp. CFH 77786]